MTSWSCGASNFCKSPLRSSLWHSKNYSETSSSCIGKIHFDSHISELFNICCELLRPLLLKKEVFGSVDN